MILAAYLGAQYAAEHPLSLSATLVFEQSYGRIDGDSASCGELCALLSALSGAPLAQNLAVTGSVNQFGQLQPVGGVNEKVEGFFDACSVLGLTGDQGVILPAVNAAHLMLRDDVVEAAREGRFQIYTARDVDEAMEILAGIPAGLRGPDGMFPRGSLNARVEERLVALAERRLELGRRREAEARP
jgi:predicted ATP-dependent protease